ncbi:hypothetical protein [Litoribacillus peritrichatus]|uniref:Uncharacterized protein n=1 Tax=Litoribacillus peritrichatus TaxID=718191 RepID=A0ABP7MQA2_9GAMM
MSSLLQHLLAFIPGSKANKKRKKLKQLRVLLKAQGQDVSNLSDDQLEYVALQVRQQVLKSAPKEKEAHKAD